MARTEKGAKSTGFFFCSAATSCVRIQRHYHFLPVPILKTVSFTMGTGGFTVKNDDLKEDCE